MISEAIETAAFSGPIVTEVTDPWAMPIGRPAWNPIVAEIPK